MKNTELTGERPVGATALSPGQSEATPRETCHPSPILTPRRGKSIDNELNLTLDYKIMNTRNILATLCMAAVGLLSCGRGGHPAEEEAAPLEWRGVMIDASRHFSPMDVLRQQVDLMGRYGLNVLHLHLTDAAGWRLEIKKYPRLTEVGAWRTHETWKDWWAARPRHDEGTGGVEWFATAYADSLSGHGGYYTQEEMRDLVAYAAERGVTIVPEIEFPAHSEEVVAAYPWLGYSHSEMDMSKDSTYLFMADVLAEVAEVFPGPYIHVGGDESETQHELKPQAMRRIQHIVEGLGRRMIMWDEGLTDDPADSAQIIMVWRDIDTATRAIRLGHEVVVCPGNWCYLDSYQDCPIGQPETMGGYRPLRHCYSLPLDSALKARGKARAGCWVCRHASLPNTCPPPRCWSISCGPGP